MRQTTVFRVWNWMFLAIALYPLGIFWVGRRRVPWTLDGDTDGTMLLHGVVSAVYLLAVVATAAWIGWTGRKGIVAALVAVAASVGAAIGFADIAMTDALTMGLLGLSSMPITLAVWMLVLLAAGNAAWVGLFTVTVAIRRRHTR